MHRSRALCKSLSTRPSGLNPTELNFYLKMTFYKDRIEPEMRAYASLMLDGDERVCVVVFVCVRSTHLIDLSVSQRPLNGLVYDSQCCCIVFVLSYGRWDNEVCLYFG